MISTLAALLVPLLLLSAFFAAVETSFIAISLEKVHKMKLEGKRKTSYLEQMLGKKEQVLTAALFGNNIVNIMSSSVATVALVNLFGNDNEGQKLGIAMVTLFMTLIIFLIGEVIPKAFALQYPENIAYYTAPLFRIFMKIFTPAVWCANIIVHSLFKIFRTGKGSYLIMSANEKLKMTIDMQHIQGDVKKNDRDMLDGILDLGTTQVRAIMTHRNDVFAIDIEDDINILLHSIINSAHSRIPCYQEKFDNIIGVLHVRDFLTELSNKDNLQHLDIRTKMHKPVFVPYSTTLKDQLTLFKKSRNHMAFVVDEYGGVMGIVTLEDLIEEIVGDIKDEHDAIDNDVTVDADGNITVTGDYPIRDFNRKFEADLRDDVASTIAGLIIDKLKRIPEANEDLVLCDYHVFVRETEDNRVKLVSMRKLIASEESNGKQINKKV